MGSIEVTWPAPHVALVTIDQVARMNALSYPMFAALGETWASLAASSARAVVVTGAGDRAFCSGADIRQDVADRPADIDRLIDAALLKTVVFPKPLLAAINGHAIAGGLELALSADLRACSEEARLGLPEVCRGIFPAGGAALKLAAQIGHPAAMDLLLTGRLIGAAEAASLRLVNAVVPRGEALSWCLRKAEEIARNSPVAVQATKEFVARAARQGAVDLLPMEAELTGRVRSSRDAQEGRAAFAERREPRWEA